jgi:hypothetical protein
LYDFAIDYSPINNKIEFIVEEKDQKDPLKAIKYYPRVKYSISIYKRPGTIVILIYLPLFSLAWVLLSIFSGVNDLNARTANICVIILAYIAFIPTLRSFVPPVSYPTLNDFALGSNLCACLATLLESFLIAKF